ncbi:chromate resistance protein ChrB domain-containing protein [Pseudooceanicola sp. LIPI14-2-Ac024]|uniref:chromate resistance protein ChrB domain-containing protein n=1 Tax=Pseudooceanicola sp. LIPI14-2-Ac024 TaxID=3344875 RepID=UPI0035CFC27D
MPAPTEITPAQLLRLIGTPDAPALIDVVTEADFAADPHVIPGAIRIPHDRVLDLVPRLRGTRCVVYCQKGLKLSQGAAAMLRCEGVAAEHLAEGMVGWRALDGAPRIPHAALPAPVGGATLWVTRHRPKIDRIACPWLIRRFVDPAARFLFVAPSEVPAVAERFGATPFDIEDVAFSHRGPHCTFDTMLDVFDLHGPALDTLARVVRGADTNRHDLAPEAAGLLALSVGLSRQYRDDLDQLAAGLPLYDALYRWARDGQGEGHDWPAGRAA